MVPSSTMQQRPPHEPTHDNSAQRARDLVARLQKSEIFRSYQEAFQTTTGLPLALRAAGSFQPPLTGAKKTNPFCGLMAAKSKTCSACLQLQQQMEESAAPGTKTLECFAGLSDSEVPIRIGGDVIAYLQTGQVMLRAPSQAQFRRTLEQLEKWGMPVNTGQLEAAYFQTRVVKKPHYQSILSLLGIFSQHLSALTNQLLVTETQAELPAVARARAFIAEHLDEEICLTRVARAVNMSQFYFCKTFKHETGLTFTDYVSRVRVERVKELLLNPHARVSEAAYAAGFQSLSQFNRAFRRIAGESPSDYRERLHGPAPTSGQHHALAA